VLRDPARIGKDQIQIGSRTRLFRPICGSLIRTEPTNVPHKGAMVNSKMPAGICLLRGTGMIRAVSNAGPVPPELPCLFCKEVGKPGSVEHVFPQGLGGHADLKLPFGAVCAPCNNWLGRQVDEALVHLLEVQLIRGIFRVPDAAGNTVDSIPLTNGTLTFSASGAIDIQVTSRRWLEQREEREVVTTIRYQRRNSGDQWRRTARAVMKFGLNLLYLEQGPDSALASDLDDIREVIRGAPYEGFLLIGPLDITRRPDLTGKIRNGFAGIDLVARLRYGGLDLTAPLVLGPPVAETRAWANSNGYHLMTINPPPNEQRADM
jgi:hypothetical protein